MGGHLHVTYLHLLRARAHADVVRLLVRTGEAAERVRGRSGSGRPHPGREPDHHHRVADREGGPPLLQEPDQAGEPRARLPGLARGQRLASRVLHHVGLQGDDPGLREAGERAAGPDLRGVVLHVDGGLHHADRRAPARPEPLASREVTMKPTNRMGILPPAMLWLVSGCAATAPAYVTPAREAQPARAARIDKRVTAVEGRMNEMSQRVQTLEGGVAGAQSRADAAARKAEGVDSRLTRLWSNRFNQKTADSLEVYFSPDSIDLSDAAQTALAAVVKEMEANPTLTVELGGYTDPRGALDYNYALIQAASLGPISSADIPDVKKRRVTIRLMVDRE